MLRLVKLEREDGISFSHLHNISDEGMMASIESPAEVGERMTISFSDERRVVGRVAWTEGARCGIAFDEAIDSLALLRDLSARQHVPAYRPPRIEVSLLGVAYSEMGVHPVRTTNLSHRGMGLSHDGRFRPGLHVMIMLENGIERRGVVRWSHHLSAGLMLTEPLACEDLNRCVDRAAGSPH